MDFATVIGLLLGILSLIIGFVLEGGALGSLIQGTAALIVFGGTAGAVVLSSSGRHIKKLPFILKYAFFQKPHRPDETINQLVNLANLSRREGLLALETQRELFENDEFLADGVQMIVDGVDSEMIQDILNRDIELYEENILSAGKIFEAAGGFAPTMGIIGTVMGLVHVLGGLEDPGGLGPSIAVAFIATLYGVGSANVIYIPIYNKIKARLAQEVLIREIQEEGIMSIQFGENTTILRKKLMAFLDADGKKRFLENKAEAASGVPVNE
ncbi:chemotaxis protein MotA [Scopulibacillus darangshiensis]|uniref:Chemotaxis protein MotA n=1 Tax=Scopulibacillus darangshiensis TaxID=442528 RepID=A0A4R2NX60_9BACL|nr:flagellar motor protein [Scopulibacillus darangshiensis]TCP26005.1 chemotaxis protein MotA [Scopulibacillus darangshiensis]